ncbi:hypothetical protein L1I30_07740 [Gillisia sp. M10.2A]|uniref:Uncharacterized protein n=1 Tax=Gillisia lutea TaxID=2909668 RepID=A0ABS9EJA2_9FLAO|nr:hypothetical protein [Gillisia lutea]MCF4101553.1 hypothetical protein [Gillisia lutea]
MSIQITIKIPNMLMEVFIFWKFTLAASNQNGKDTYLNLEQKKAAKK